MAAIAIEHRQNDQRALSAASFSGVQKAAIFLLCLGEHATNLWSRLEDDEIKDISQAMATLGMISGETAEALILDFVHKLSVSGSLMGSADQTRRVLSAFLDPERVSTLMDEISGPAGRNVWDKLANVNETVLANYLSHEYPQTVAVIVGKLKPGHAARVLAALPEDFAMDCVGRLLEMDAVQRSVLDNVEETLRSEFIANLSLTSKRNGNHQMMAEIFNNLDRATEGRLMLSLDQQDHDSAERVRALMFVFDDLEGLDRSGVQTLMRVVDKTDLALALKGASDGMRTLFLSSMSERGAKLLREDMAARGAVRLKDVSAAQGRLVALAKDLAAKGDVMLAGRGAEDELVY